MPDTAVPYSNLVPNGQLDDPTGTAIVAANNHVISRAMPELTVLRVANTSGAARDVTVKAGDMPPAIAAGLGDYTTEIGATTGVEFLGPFESGRFLQSDGSLVVTVEAGFTGTITAFKIPRNT